MAYKFSRNPHFFFFFLTYSIKTVHWCMFNRVDFRAVIFHDPSDCVSVTIVLWLALSKETSPLIVVIHHLATGTHGDHKAFYFLLEMNSVYRMYMLKNLRKAQAITLMFECMPRCWITLTIDTEWSKMLWAACKHAHNSYSCSGNVFSWIFLDIQYVSWLHVLSEGTLV